MISTWWIKRFKTEKSFFLDQVLDNTSWDFQNSYLIRLRFFETCFGQVKFGIEFTYLIGWQQTSKLHVYFSICSLKSRFFGHHFVLSFLNNIESFVGITMCCRRRTAMVVLSSLTWFFTSDFLQLCSISMYF